MSAVLAVQRAELQNAGGDRERQVLAYLTNAYQVTLAATNAIERYEVVRDIQALKTLAKAYNLSEEATRALGETSIRCLRLFGLALRKSLPGESHESMHHRSKVTGANVGTCQHASALAAYSTEDLSAAFTAVRELQVPTAVKYVYAALRGNNPRLRRVREKKGLVVPSIATGRKLMNDALKVCLALAFRIIEVKEYTYADARRDYGMSLRTYRRYLARLRAAGMILDSPMGGGRGEGYVRFLAIDSTLAEARIA
jgi:hypothetical protein